MTYRDDRDALHARNEALAAEVAALREQLEAAREPALVVSVPRRSRASAAVAAALVGASVAAFALVMLVRGAVQHEPSPRTAVATWDAKVVESDASTLPVGTRCLVESKLRTGSGAPQAASPTIRCGDVAVYDPADPRYLGLAPATFAVAQHMAPAEGDESHVAMIYDLSFEEQRDGMPHLVLDTARGVGSLARDNPELHVQLQIAPGSHLVVPSF